MNKKDLIKKKNNDTKQESWVRGLSLSQSNLENIRTQHSKHQHRYNAIHAKDGFMICCLFNHRNNQSSSENKYECPHCVLKKLEESKDEDL